MKKLVLNMIKWTTLIVVGLIAVGLVLSAILNKVDPEGMAKIRSEREAREKIEVAEKEAKAKERLAKAETVKAQAEEQIKAAKTKDEAQADAIAAQEMEPVTVISALRLSQAYDDNELAAEEAFKNKFVTITGRITSIGSDITGTPYIIIDEEAQCLFTKADKPLLARLVKNTRIAITGKVSSKFWGTVIVRNCELTVETRVATKNKN
jgi:hypothetical protein